MRHCQFALRAASRDDLRSVSFFVLTLTTLVIFLCNALMLCLRLDFRCHTFMVRLRLKTCRMHIKL